MPIRKGSRRVEVYNSALGVYLYDPANADSIRATGAALSDPKGIATLRGQRLLVCYGLMQDDELDVEVVVGPPLTVKELEKGRWMRTQRTRLHIPSGTLHVDSADTLRLGAEEPTDEGATVEVPKGEYVLTLYRIFHDQLSAEGISRYRGPQEVVVLTPAAEAEPLASEEAYLPFEPEVARLPWLKAYKVTGPRFEGLVESQRTKGMIVTNLDRDAAKELGLQFGSGLRLEAGKVTQTAVYLDDNIMLEEYLESLAGPRAQKVAGLQGAWFWKHHDAHGYEVLLFGLPDEVTLKARSPITITKLAEPIEPYDEEAWFGHATVSGAEIAGKVVRLYWESGWPHLVLSVDETALTAIEANPGDRLRLQVGDVVTPLPLFATSDDLWRASRKPSVPTSLILEYGDAITRNSAASRKKAATLWKELDRLRRSESEGRLPVGGFLRADKRVRDKKLLEVQPMVFPSGWIDAPYPAYDFATEPGTAVRIRKAEGLTIDSQT
jgi:hypothetical protein